jgi:hypothetical protein
VVINWTTNEKSTTQVKYGASPESLSPLDETTVTEHVVELTDLNPYTTYRFWVMSRDQASNLAVSEEYSFTTLGEPATFTVSALEVSPSEVNTGKPVNISVTVTNIGDVAGSYEVTLSISAGSGSEIMKQVVELDAGASQKVTFIATKEVASVFTASVGDLKASFTVKEAPQPEITLFSVIPGYDSVTLKPTSARVTYQVKNLTGSVTDAGLVLKVSLNGEPLESVVLISPGQPISDTGVSSWDYIPSAGWVSGNYTFRAELSADGRTYATTSEETLEIKAEPPAVVNWSILMIIIGAMLMAITAVVVVLLSRRREIIKTWVEDGRSSPPMTRRR